jgi:hypothetical protein
MLHREHSPSALEVKQPKNTDSLALRLKAVQTSERSGLTHPTRRNITEDLDIDKRWDKVKHAKEDNRKCIGLGKQSWFEYHVSPHSENTTGDKKLKCLPSLVY